MSLWIEYWLSVSLGDINIRNMANWSELKCLQTGFDVAELSTGWLYVCM